MSGEVTIITTGDGSHSLFNSALNETYHSRHGAIQESRHVFIDHGLRYFIDQVKRKDITILEVGFGTGLNCLLTASEIAEAHLRYVTIEAFPLGREIYSQLNYGHGDDASLFDSLHEADWDIAVRINERFVLHKIHTKIEIYEGHEGPFDVVYFDAFAPSRQPEVWDISVISRIHSIMSTHGVFVTYCAQGQLKRNLKAAGFTVETLPGPPGKKEMVRAIKTGP